jgi:predicted transcriptional regulator YdeE
VALGQPRFVDRPAFTVAGLRRMYTPATVTQFLTQWTEMRSRIQFVTGRVGGDAYGLWFDVLKGREFTYLTGLQVGEFAPLSLHFDAAVIAAQHYAVFTHEGDANAVRSTIDAALKWLPQSGRELAQLENAPDFFERYSEEYNATGQGPVEVWLAIKKR